MARVEHDLSDEQWAALKDAWDGCAYSGVTDRLDERTFLLRHLEIKAVLASLDGSVPPTGFEPVPPPTGGGNLGR